MNKPLYDRDFYAWTQEQADAIRRRSVNELDWENLQEEVESMGKQERSTLHSHLVVLLQHLLKWRFRPERRGRSWSLTIDEQRLQAERVLRQNPSLRPQLEEVVAEAYAVATRRAAREMKRPLKSLPTETPFTLDEVFHAPTDWPEED